MTLVHGTTIAIDGAAVLLRGPSGAGKSDLALRLIDGGAELVADDQTALAVFEDSVAASSPAPIAGMLEVRGVGIIRVPYCLEARLRLVVDLIAEPGGIERLPEARLARLGGVDLPLIALWAHEPSAPIKIRWALRGLSGCGEASGADAALGDTGFAAARVKPA